MIDKVKLLELNRMTKDELIDRIDCLECALLMEQKRSARRQERIDAAYEAGFFDAIGARATDIGRCIEKFADKIGKCAGCEYCPCEYNCDEEKSCEQNMADLLRKMAAKELKEANHEG